MQCVNRMRGVSWLGLYEIGQLLIQIGNIVGWLLLCMKCTEQCLDCSKKSLHCCQQLISVHTINIQANAKSTTRLPQLYLSILWRHKGGAGSTTEEHLLPKCECAGCQKQGHAGRLVEWSICGHNFRLHMHYAHKYFPHDCQTPKYSTISDLLMHCGKTTTTTTIV